jgi:ribonuclease HII
MRWRLGIDENGLGPRLGPLVVTGVLAHLTPAGERRMREAPQLLLHERLDDSKALVDHRDVRLGEAWARALCLASGSEPCSPDELLGALSYRDRSWLRAPCPAAAREQCWSCDGEAFASAEADVARANDDLDALAHAGVQVRWVRSEVTCARRINEARAAGRGRLQLDLASMEQLVLAARQVAGAEILAVCGKVGGIRRYGPALERLGAGLHTVLEEGPACSSYRFAGVGEVRFVRDADGADPLVALASLVGKYVREVLMKRVVRFYRAAIPGLGDASGYNDPVTGRFVAATREARARMGVPDACFRREQTGDEGEAR